MPFCVAVNCNKQTENNKEVSFHSYPKDQKVFKRWEAAIGRTELPKSGRLCSAHFEPTCYEGAVDLKKALCGNEFKSRKTTRRRLKKDAVPSIFQHKELPKARSLSAAREKRAEHSTIIEEVLREHLSQPEIVDDEIENIEIEIEDADVGYQVASTQVPKIFTVHAQTDTLSLAKNNVQRCSFGQIFKYNDSVNVGTQTDFDVVCAECEQSQAIGRNCSILLPFSTPSRQPPLRELSTIRSSPVVDDSSDGSYRSTIYSDSDSNGIEDEEVQPIAYDEVASKLVNNVKNDLGESCVLPETGSAKDSFVSDVSSIVIEEPNDTDYQPEDKEIDDEEWDIDEHNTCDQDFNENGRCIQGVKSTVPTKKKVMAPLDRKNKFEMIQDCVKYKRFKY